MNKDLEQTELNSSYNSIKTELNDDAISRQAAIDCITYDEEYTIECLKALPPAVQQPYKGESEVSDETCD